MGSINYETVQGIINWVGLLGLAACGIGLVSHDPDPRVTDPLSVRISIKLGFAIMVLAIVLTGLAGHFLS